jgi:uncharacterized SAM-binding protein YcdF (DUF218 family)
MLLAVEKIISSFVTLPGIFLMLNIIIFIYLLKVSWSNIIKIISGFTVLLMIITFTGLGLHILVFPLENYATNIDGFNESQIEEIPIVVLGGGINYDVTQNLSELSSISRDRLIKGILISKANNMPLIYSGGIGIGYEDKGESEIALNFVNNFNDIEFIQENEARTTYENGLKIKDWLTENNYEKIYLVTSAIHMRRSIGVFDNIGINYIPVVSNYTSSHKLSWLDYLPNRGALDANMQAVHEWVGLIWYKINNRI